MSDSIYRQDAIDALDKRFDIIPMEQTTEILLLRKDLRELPSAQPEIIRCKDCKHYFFADNRIPQEQRYSCALDGDRWKPDSFCSFAERKTE